MGGAGTGGALGLCGHRLGVHSGWPGLALGGFCSCSGFRVLSLVSCNPVANANKVKYISNQEYVRFQESSTFTLHASAA